MPVNRTAAGLPAAPIIVAVLLFAALAVVAPLAVYTVTLALFGLPHVISEMRYVDRRFSRRIGPGLLATIGGILLLIAAARATSVFHVLPARTALCLELGLVGVLALTVARGSAVQRAAALAVALAIGAAAAFAPFDTAVTFSVLHNVTPLGFLWQLTPPARRGRVMTWAGLALVALPLLVATGLPRLVLAGAGMPGLDPLGAGPLGEHLFVYVPQALATSGHAIDFFTAAVVAQGGHYLSVIVVLPLMLARIEPGAKGVVAWPRAGWFAGLLVLAAGLGAAMFSASFSDARAYYGIFASMHAWVEIPVLILALTGANQWKKIKPARQDAELAASETSIAL